MSGNARVSRSRLNPPIPHEHGAWVILYAPLVLGVAAAARRGPVPVGSVVLIAACVTALFLAREAASIAARRRHQRAWALPWLFLYGGLAMACALPLLVAGHTGLLLVGAVAAAIFVAHQALQFVPSRKRLDRTVLGEALGAAALCLTAPAAWAASGVGAAAIPWALWAACTAYFVGGIVMVKATLAAGLSKTPLPQYQRARIARAPVAYHALLALAAAVAAWHLGGIAGLSVIAAYAPAIVRAFTRCRGLSHVLPDLLRVGMAESAYAAWFVAWMAAAVS